MDATASIDNCYSIGLITSGGTYAGGFAGFSSEPDINVISASYWDTETSGTETSDGGTGHITTWMKTKSNYTDAGWDMDNIWYQEYTPAVPESETTIEIDLLRLVGFEYPQEKSYVIAMGDKKMAFFKSR